MAQAEQPIVSAEYGRLLTEAYDLDKPLPDARTLAFYSELVAGRGPVLEAMSGSGRYLVPMAAAGLDIDGADASKAMLAACRAKAATLGMSPALVLQAVEELDLPRRYGAIIILAGSFGLIRADDEVRAALARIRKHLLPGGLLAFEVETPVAVEVMDGNTRWWRRGDGSTIVLRMTTTYDPATQVETGIGIYESFVEGRLVETELDHWSNRYWTGEQIRAVLESEGFVDVEICAEQSRSPAGRDDDAVTVLATAAAAVSG